MSPRRRIPGPVLDAVRIAKIEHPNWTPAQIHKEVTGHLGELAVSYRTVQRIVASLRPAKPGATWDFWESDPDDAALLMPIRRVILEHNPWNYPGRWQFTIDEAEVALRIRRAFPDLDDARTVYALAWTSTGSAGWRDQVEVWLAFTPWRDDGAALMAAVESGRVTSTVMVLFKTISGMWKEVSDER